MILQFIAPTSCSHCAWYQVNWKSLYAHQLQRFSVLHTQRWCGSPRASTRCTTATGRVPKQSESYPVTWQPAIWAEIMQQEQKRMNYVTPTNYLELVQGYMKMLKACQSGIEFECIKFMVQLRIHRSCEAVAFQFMHRVRTCSDNYDHALFYCPLMSFTCLFKQLTWYLKKILAFKPLKHEGGSNIWNGIKSRCES